MRPHLQFHDSADVLSGYDLRRGGQLLGGTLIAATPTRLRDLMQGFGGDHGFVHVTLSAPPGLWLERDSWLRIFRYVLDRHGLPSDRSPWVLTRHSDGACDHGHAVAAQITFTGLALKPIITPAHTDETHRRVARLLGLEEPYYYDHFVGPRVHAHAPARRLKGNGLREQLATELNPAYSSKSAGKVACA